MNKVKEELPAFAQYLINLNYDPIKAKTVMNNSEKESLVNVGKNRYQEFADRLKSKDVDWFNESQVSTNNILDDKIYIKLKDINGKILKDTALEIYNDLPHIVEPMHNLVNTTQALAY